jgi:hypothetical protein
MNCKMETASETCAWHASTPDPNGRQYSSDGATTPANVANPTGQNPSTTSSNKAGMKILDTDHPYNADYLRGPGGVCGAGG